MSEPAVFTGSGSGSRRGVRLWPVVALGVWLLAGLGASSGQKPEPYALLAGTVWSASGRAVPGVKVKIRRIGDKKVNWELITNSRGEFVQRLPAAAADYVVWVELKGHQEPVVERTLHFASDERQDIGLHLPE
jgi:hypothetical protein